uniref:Uncharacterized protein n=1 Tax=Rhizophora mucronata TaxID=61149 RepID=A0A2P2P931_RHIMU
MSCNWASEKHDPLLNCTVSDIFVNLCIIFHREDRYDFSK